MTKTGGRFRGKNSPIGRAVSRSAVIAYPTCEPQACACPELQRRLVAPDSTHPAPRQVERLRPTQPFGAALEELLISARLCLAQSLVFPLRLPKCPSHRSGRDSLPIAPCRRVRRAARPQIQPTVSVTSTN